MRQKRPKSNRPKVKVKRMVEDETIESELKYVFARMDGATPPLPSIPEDTEDVPGDGDDSSDDDNKSLDGIDPNAPEPGPVIPREDALTVSKTKRVLPGEHGYYLIFSLAC